VFEEHVDASVATVDAQRVQKIGVKLAQRVVDEAAGLDGQGREVHAGDQLRREYVAQLFGRVRDLREGGLEQGVVRGRGHGAGP